MIGSSPGDGPYPPAPQTPPRERWGTRVGLVLAMAGSAVGLGNFLRFPVQVAENGGGAFMVPYVVALLVVGLPMMWVEWTVGRLGGVTGYGTVPGMFHRLWAHPLARYLGVVGLLIPLVILVYYTVIVGWLLGFAFFSMTGSYFGLGVEGVQGYLASFQDIHDTSQHGGWVGLAFYLVTVLVIVRVVARGISGGIEKLALFGMPLLFLLAVAMMIRVLTLPATEVGSPAAGLAFIWTPDWSALRNARVWLAATGQVFFTLSLGSGIIHTYASYLTEHDDLPASGMATAATNEIAEVGLGGTIAIPAAVTFLGVGGATALAAGGTFDLGIVAMAVVFQGLPGGEFIGRFAAFSWFFLLFIAGLTSSVALASPAMAFLQEEFGVDRRRVARWLGVVAAVLGLANIWWYAGGFLGEWDFWAGTFGLVVFAWIEICLVRFAFGLGPFWDELHRGSSIRVPIVFRYVIGWVTPACLTVLLLWWGWVEALPALRMDGVPAEQLAARWWARGALILMLVTWLVLIRVSVKRRSTGGAP